MKVDMDPTRMGFGRGLERAGEDPRVVTLHADISGSIRITDFEAKHPERNNRVFSIGIAGQNMMSVAAGLARGGTSRSPALMEFSPLDAPGTRSALPSATPT
jgi:transketolase C-terminal domain/subunit